ncbi:2Fe-2S iron-sulfur cluster-binding protein [Enemella evansiae]|uniref:2Fe-2S iron-sulfur cluster-binding protein n=1 Tax=Enemella evansiae TaxID=2016499 RepID=UPI000B9793C3|nr:2Fe-2S iron-sulfur cluster-binding protein [Enemella evansiae]OYO00853.1 ferredoxin [Enemella evansiae]OYO02525.1 ferredoxin [Enemella evansiae]OYO03020.1 ferredoxin [Enemella evansiae]PFG69225.1 2Fe-2S ferredoxin [Propionibacteriaceae bacterium ES.041]
MPHISYTHSDGSVDEVDVETGVSVMRAALANGVDGIVGECGGQAMCATCHVYVADQTGLPEISEDEEEMLEETASERTEESRLGCQLTAGADFETLAVRIPEEQV